MIRCSFLHSEAKIYRRRNGISSGGFLHSLRRSRVFYFLLVAVLLYCSGCTDTSQGRQTSSPLSGPYASTPGAQKGGNLVLGDLQFPTSANPLFASSNADLTISSMLWGQPVFYDQQFRVHPDQLTEVPLPENGGVLDGGKTIVMHLRHDLYWSDGHPLFASDFQYWWRLNQDANTGATTTAGYDQIASIETPDNVTVVLHMKRPFGPYLFYLPYAAPQHVWGRLQPLELQNTASIFQAPTVTSGPYLLKALTGKRYMLTANPRYISTTFKGPFLSELVYQGYNTLSSLMDAVKNGQVDLTQGYHEGDLPLLTQLASPQVTIIQGNTVGYEHLDFNLGKPLLQDIRIRKAIQASIDTCSLLKQVLQATDCTRRITQVEPAPSLYNDPTIPEAPYSVSESRQLLAQAGWQTDQQGKLSKNGQPLVLNLVTLSADPLRKAIAEKLQQYLLAIGIESKVGYYSLSDFFGSYTKGGVLATGAYDLALFSYANSPEPDDEYTVFHSSQIPTADHPYLSNYGRVNDGVIDLALTDGRDKVAFSERRAAYSRFLRRLAEQVYLVPLFVDRKVMTMSKHVENFILNPNQSATTWNVSDWWVKR